MCQKATKVYITHLGLLQRSAPSAFTFFNGTFNIGSVWYNTVLTMAESKHHRMDHDGEAEAAYRRLHHKRRRMNGGKFHMQRYAFHRLKGSDGPGEARGDRGQLQGPVHEVLADHNYVRRTYTSDRVYRISNLNTVQYNANAWTLNFVFDTVTATAHAEIMLGSPQQGVGTPTGVLFQNLEDEFQALTNVYRYFKITKFQMTIDKLPQAVYIPSQAVPTVATNQQQGGTWTNMGDPGRMLMRPWTGCPGVANYSSGALTAVDWDDHNRFATKRVESAMGHVDHPMKCCVVPIQPVIIPDAPSAADVSGSVRYDAVPAIDISNFSTGACEASCYGIIQYWYFPACQNAVTGFLSTTCSWEIEIEYFGLKPPTAFTPAPMALPAGQAYVDSQDALIASVTGQQLELVPKPVKPVPSEVTSAVVQEKKDADSLSTAMSDVVIVSSQVKKAAAAKSVSQQVSVPTPNNTPRKK